MLHTHSDRIRQTLYFAGLSICLFLNHSLAHSGGFAQISPYQAEYKLKSSKYKISATAKRSLSMDSKQNAQLSQKSAIMIAKIEQKSKFKIENNSCAIAANNYSYYRKIFGKKTNYRVSFDSNKRQFTETKNDKNKTLSYDGPLYDELSYQEALRCELKNQTELKVGQQFDYQIRTKGKNKTYRFQVSAIEKINTKLGKVNTVKVSRLRDGKGKDKNSQIWFSKDHDYVLVRFRQEEKDDLYSLEIKSLKLK